ncbi:MAG: hypothetical protein ACXVPN_00260 [Bacteroidia bacterium]
MKTTIKNTAIAALIIISLLVTGNASPRKVASHACLTISGKVLNKKASSKEKIKVYLIKGNAVIDSLKVRPNITFSFSLERDQEYSIKIVQNGYANRLICVSTWLPEKLKENNLFEFHFDLLPYKGDNYVNQDALDFPVALVYYEAAKGYFDYNKKYTSYIKKEFNQPVFDDNAE